MNTILDEGLSTVAQASEFLSLSRSEIWRLMKVGDLPYTVVGKCGRRIPRIALRDYASKRLVLGR